MKKFWKVILIVFLALVLFFAGFYFYKSKKSSNFYEFGQNFSLKENGSVNEKTVKIKDTNNEIEIISNGQGGRMVGGGTGLVSIFINGEKVPMDHCTYFTGKPENCNYEVKTLSEYGYSLNIISIESDDTIIANITKTN